MKETLKGGMYTRALGPANLDESPYLVMTRDYAENFWEHMKGKAANKMDEANLGERSYMLPYADQTSYAKALKDESLFRQIGTIIPIGFSRDTWLYTDENAYMKWQPKPNINDNIDAKAILTSFNKLEIEAKRLMGITRIDFNFFADNNFNVKPFLINRFAKMFGDEEEKVFVNGNGTDTPLGILADEGGADVGVTSTVATSLSWEEVYKLFFSVESKYRKKGSWVINDTTALALRCMKDSSGRFIWNEANDTILGRPVFIANHMPDIGAGAKPIAFGDFSYYGIFEKLPLAVRTLQELFVHYGHMGYLGSELVDGRLIRPDAVKVIKMAD